LGKLGIPGHKPTRGITVVEILVILACMALLAAILFPLFSHLRETAYRTKCASNMMQLTRAFQTYAQDWSDYWPCPGGRVGDYAYWHQTGNGGLESYVKQRDRKSVWCCPLMPEWKSIYDPRSYCMNSYLRNRIDIEYPTCCNPDKDLMTGIRASSIPEMDRTILLFEGLPLRVEWEGDPDYVYIYRCCNWTGVKGYSPLLYPMYTIDPGRPWHGRVSNYVYTDGHLAARPPGSRTVGKLSTHKEMYEWYVDKDIFETVKWPVYARAGAAYE
jgi:prepilin-type processing-associated H-X9-DG protein